MSAPVPLLHERETTTAPPHIHANALALGEYGLLITGASGAGKSSLTLALLERAAQQGIYARLVADDRCHISVQHMRLIAGPHKELRGKIEIYGRGIVNAPFQAAVRISHCITLSAEVLPRMPDEECAPPSILKPWLAPLLNKDAERIEIAQSLHGQRANGGAQTLKFINLCSRNSAHTLASTVYSWLKD